MTGEAQPPRRQRDPPIHHPAQQPRLRRTATPHPRPGRSLLAALVHAHREARRSSPERTAPASAGSRSFRTGKARPPGLLGTPRGSRARTDHTSRSSPATCRSAAGPRCPARGTILIGRHFTSASPTRPFKRPLAPLPWSGPARPAPVTVVAPGRRVPAAGSASPGGRACHAGASSQSPSIQSGHFPCQIQAGPRSHGAIWGGPAGITA